MGVEADTSSLRTAASSLRAQADKAQTALRSIPESIPSEVWSGSAATQVNELLPGYRGELATATATLRQAASVLDELARRIDDKLGQVAAAKQKLASLNPHVAGVGPMPMATIDAYGIFRAEQAVHDREGELKALIAAAGRELDGLTGKAKRSKAARFSVPGADGPGSGADRPWYGDAWHFVAETGGGLLDWGKKTVDGVWDLGFLVTMSTPPGVMIDAIRGNLGERQKNFGKGFWDLGGSLIHHPGDTLYAMFDITTLKESPGRWIGRVGPDVVLMFVGLGEAKAALKGATITEELGDLSKAARAGDVAADAARLDRLAEGGRAAEIASGHGLFETSSFTKSLAAIKSELPGYDALMEHITEGGYNASRNRLTGYHSFPGGKIPSDLVLDIEYADGPSGAYSGFISKSGGEPKFSTFFPDSWGEERVAREIHSAFTNQIIPPTGPFNLWYGKSASGMMIEGFMRDGKIVSAYPQAWH